MPVPPGWTPGGAADSFGTPDFPGFLGRFGTPDAMASERFHRAGIVVILDSGGTSDGPTVSPYARFRWRGVIVHEASGVPTPPPDEAAWQVADTWLLDGHPYRLYVLGVPRQGPSGQSPSGRVVARHVLKALQYTPPSG